MKKILFALSLLASTAVFAQQPEESRDAENGSKVLKGFIPVETLSTDTAFAWYASGIKSFTPNAEALAALRAHKDSVYLLAFGGTWCDDTKQVLPKMMATFQAAGVSADHVTLLGVDRQKHTVQHLSEAFNITNVPTFIVLRNGKEVGRIVEYGSTGLPEKEIGKIVAAGFK
ncbi:thioredoxin family protein [Flaviaesturariibacter aridisoli]|nr:thioredoxin family protein [Flaviaesturariibacter aridisoli]